MENTLKRFRIFDLNQEKLVKKFDTTLECYDFLTEQERQNEYMIDDVVDDIQVDWEVFMDAFNSGEYPGDLQMF